MAGHQARGKFNRCALLEQGDKRIGIALADVAGKGVAAALIMSVVQASLRIISTEDGISLPELAAKMNRFLHRSTASNSYATFFYAQLDEQSRQLRYVNAGHLPPYLNGKELAVEGALPLGVVAGMQFPASHFRLADGDSMMLMTDGVAEAQDEQGRLFGFERIGELLHKGAGGAALAAAAQDFGQQDDITILTLTPIAVEVLHA